MLNDSLMFPHIPGTDAGGSGVSATGARGGGKARRGPQEWGETAARKHAGSLAVTQKGLELLKLAAAP